MRPRVRAWPLAAFASLSTFALAMLGCAVRGWHAPRPWAIVAILVIGVALGAKVAEIYSRDRAPERDTGLKTADRGLELPAIVRAKTVGLLPLATVFGLTTAILGALGVVMIIDSWRALLFASTVGSLWMATYPLHVLGWYALIERNVMVGLDGVRVGGHVISFKSIRRASRRGRRTIVIERGSAEPPLSYDVANEGVADALIEKINERIVDATSLGVTGLGRDGRSFDAWKRDLLAPDYRARVVSVEDATRVLHAGAASPDERLGAALVLAADGKQVPDSNGRALVRVTAMKCVDRNLRAALERIAEDGELDEQAALRVTSR